MATLFISDLHLSPARPELLALLQTFIRRYPRPGDSLYILGDLFEVWLGDDAADDSQRAAMSTLHALADAGTAIFFIHGNRDFLAGSNFEELSGCQLLSEPAVITLSGEPVLLMHGDSLCTDDVEYQAFKARVRQPEIQAQFLALPVAQRQAIARGYRAESESATRRKPMEIMDVNQQAVETAMRAAGVHRLIHGHTHRQAIHEFMLDGARAERIVLGDWHDTGCVLMHDEVSGWRMENFEAGTS
ncbi:MAG: UDP-2,3-diacylglucosamine diphosphatase [Chromatiales bacterium]|jgi:UDP-2,3-diacylglucosamine hydrolase|nr:UDP-2,3-diacylglucosamine diphosphatase [Chromatiales bacterium]